LKILEVTGLKKYFKTLKAVDDISFSIEKGEIVGFLGPNGAGKTTTINCLMDFLRPTAGEIKIFGKDIREFGVAAKKEIGFLSSDVHLYHSWTGWEHVKFIESIKGKSTILKALASDFQLDLSLKVKNLSTGNKQKLGIIMGLMSNPKLLILDEPSRGLDPMLQNKLYEYLEDFHKKGVTIFMSSHILTEIERVCEKVCIIKKGKIVAFENLSNLKKKKIFIVKVTFKEALTKVLKDFQDFEISSSYGNIAFFKVKQDLNPMIRKLANYDLQGLEINHASLEEIFFEYYEER